MGATEYGIARFNGTAWHSIFPVTAPPSEELVVESPILWGGFSALTLDGAGMLWATGFGRAYILSIDYFN